MKGRRPTVSERAAMAGLFERIASGEIGHAQAAIEMGLPLNTWYRRWQRDATPNQRESKWKLEISNHVKFIPKTKLAAMLKLPCPGEIAQRSIDIKRAELARPCMEVAPDPRTSFIRVDPAVRFAIDGFLAVLDVKYAESVSD